MFFVIQTQKKFLTINLKSNIHFTHLIKWLSDFFTETVPVFGAPVAGSATASVPENSPAETSVFDVVTSDADGNAPSLTLLSQDPGNNFELVGSQLRVADGAVLDFESVTTSYTVVFR